MSQPLKSAIVVQKQPETIYKQMGMANPIKLQKQAVGLSLPTSVPDDMQDSEKMEKVIRYSNN